MILVFGSDHAGFAFKEELKTFSKELGHDVFDVGVHTERAVDYPDIAEKLVMKLKEEPNALGCLICGTGIGMSIAANRHPGVRAAVVHENPEAARLARAHNNANILCLGARLITLDHAQKALALFLTTPFEEGRHRVRVDKLG